MADPLSLTASLIAVAGAAISTSKIVFRVGHTLVRAQRQINDLAQGLVHFNSIIRTLSRVIATAPDALNRDGVKDAKRVCRNCSNIVREIRRVFRKLDKDDLTIVERIKWIFKQDSLRFPKAKLESAKTDLMLIIEILNLSINLQQASSWKEEVLRQQYETIKLNIAASFANDVEVGSSELVEEGDESSSDAGAANGPPCTSLVRIQDTRDQGHFAGLCTEQTPSVTHVVATQRKDSGKEVISTAYGRMEDHAADLVPYLLRRWTNTSVSKDLTIAISEWDGNEEVRIAGESERRPATPNNNTSHQMPTPPSPTPWKSRNRVPIPPISNTRKDRIQIPSPPISTTRNTPPISTTRKDRIHNEDVPNRPQPKNSTNSKKQGSVDCTGEDATPYNSTYKRPSPPPIELLTPDLYKDWRDLGVRSFKFIPHDKDRLVPMAYSDYSTFHWPFRRDRYGDSVSSWLLISMHMPPWNLVYDKLGDEHVLIFRFELDSFLQGQVRGRGVDRMLREFFWFGAPVSACSIWRGSYAANHGEIYRKGVTSVILGFWLFMMIHFPDPVSGNRDVLEKLQQVNPTMIHGEFVVKECHYPRGGRERPEKDGKIILPDEWHGYIQERAERRSRVASGPAAGLFLPDRTYLSISAQSPTDSRR